MRNPHSLVYSIAKAKLRMIPYKVNYAVTYQCNGRCRICNIWKRYLLSPEKQQEELILPEIDAIFKDFDLSWVSLTGGEPFLREDLADIVVTIENHNPSLQLLSIPTNGSLPGSVEKQVERILDETEISNVVVSLSLNGNEPLHDYIQGVKGSWKKAQKTYQFLESIADPKFMVFLEYTVSKHNAGHLKETLDSFGVTDYSRVVLTAAHSSYFYNTASQDLHEHSSAEQVRTFLSLTKCRTMENVIPHIYTTLLEKYLRGALPSLGCVSGRSSLFLDPYGNLFPCITMGTSFGNLKKSPLHQVLHGEHADSIRKKIRKRECPGCWTPCEAYQTILEKLPTATVHALK